MSPLLEGPREAWFWASQPQLCPGRGLAFRCRGLRTRLALWLVPVGLALVGTTGGDSTSYPQALPSLHSQAAMGLSCEREAFPTPSKSGRGVESNFWFCFSSGACTSSPQGAFPGPTYPPHPGITIPALCSTCP